MFELILHTQGWDLTLRIDAVALAMLGQAAFELIVQPLIKMFAG